MFALDLVGGKIALANWRSLVRKNTWPPKRTEGTNGRKGVQGGTKTSRENLRDVDECGARGWRMEKGLKENFIPRTCVI